MRAAQPFLKSSFAPVIALAMAASLWAALGSTRAEAQEPMTLRVNDAHARPGGVAAVVLRTYAPRPIRQGQFCFFAGSRLTRGGEPPFAGVEELIVFSEAGDAVTAITFENDPGGQQTVMVEFSSESSGINRSDGPLAVIYLRLAPGVTPGQVIDIDLDLANTFFLDEDGNPVPVELRNGELDILSAEAPMELAAGGEEVRPGGVAHLAVETKETRELGSGSVGFRYDPAIAARLPTVSVDPRFGSATLDVEHPEPGLVVIGFSSSNGSLNHVPGTILKIDLLTVADVPLGTFSPISLDPEYTSVKDASLTPLSLALAADAFEFVAVPPFFRDGFEAGDFSGWTLSIP